MKTVIMIEFATRQKNSLLLWQVHCSSPLVSINLLSQGNYEERHYFALAIVNGFLEFRFSMGAQPVVIRFVVLSGLNVKQVILIRCGTQFNPIITLFADQGCGSTQEKQ